VTDHETITVALLYAALTLVGPAMLTRLMQFALSNDATNLAAEIATVVEGVTR
jgi:hypothetical protein